jgi:hypothetical protein
MGSVLSRVHGPVDPAVPPYIDMSHRMAHDPWNSKGPGFVGAAHAPFDWHGANFAHARKVVPLLGQGIAALVQDLHERGLEKDVTVLVWGEFGRTPKINENAGRDHWPKVHAALLAGGGMGVGHLSWICLADLLTSGGSFQFRRVVCTMKFDGDMLDFHGIVGVHESFSRTNHERHTGRIGP